MNNVKDRDSELSDIVLSEMRKGVARRREQLFRKNWKNRRPSVPLRSLHQERSFRFVIEWYEEFDEVVGRERERMRLDNLIEKGLDVNAPENKK